MFSHISAYDRRAMVKTVVAAAVFMICLLLSSCSDSESGGSILDNPPAVAPPSVAAPVLPEVPTVGATHTVAAVETKVCDAQMCPRAVVWLVIPHGNLTPVERYSRTAAVCRAHRDELMRQFSPDEVYVVPYNG